MDRQHHILTVDTGRLAAGVMNIERRIRRYAGRLGVCDNPFGRARHSFDPPGHQKSFVVGCEMLRGEDVPQRVETVLSHQDIRNLIHLRVNDGQ